MHAVRSHLVELRGLELAVVTDAVVQGTPQVLVAQALGVSAPRISQLLTAGLQLGEPERANQLALWSAWRYQRFVVVADDIGTEPPIKSAKD